MKVTPSPLVSEMRGKTAGLVAATWKGIQYVRMHVIPGNPQTAAQTAVREAFARCVTLWRSLSGPFKTWLDTYYSDYAMSGFNGFIRLNRTLEDADALLKPVPDSPYQPAPEGAAFATGAGAAGTIDITWTDNSIDGYTRCYGIARRADANEFAPSLAVDSDAEAMTLTGLDAGEDYDVYVTFRHAVTGHMGSSAGELDVAAKA